MASVTETLNSPARRKFGYCEVLWEIENYLCGTCHKYWIIDSPEFNVNGSQITKWRLLLKPRYVKDRYAVDVFINRVESDCFQGPVRVRWKLLYSSGDIEHVISEASSVFDRKSIYGLEIQNIKAIELKMRKSSNDRLKIRCIMIVFDKDGIKCNAPSDLGLKSLSQDMTVLFRVNRKFDIMLMMGKVIHANKAVLCARNKLLKSEILKDTEKIEIDYAWVEKEAAENLIAFLYSGNLEYVLRMPSFSMHVLIDYFRIGELKNYFVKDELTIRTIFDLQEIQTSWFIPSAHLTEKELLSDEWKLGFLDTSFRLRLLLNKASKEKKTSVKGQAKPVGKENRVIVLNLFDPISQIHGLATDSKVSNSNQTQDEKEQVKVQKFDANEQGAVDEYQEKSVYEEKQQKEINYDVDKKTDYVAIYGEFVNGMLPKEAYLTCTVYSEDTKYIVMEGVNCTLDKDKKFGIENFFNRSMLTNPNFLYRDELSIVTKLRIPSGTKKQCIVSSKTFSMGEMKDDYHYEKLSKNLGTLFETAEYSDLFISSRAMRFPAHKAIVSTRSHVFSKLIGDLKDEDLLSIQDIESHILRILLRYIYTGVLEDYKPEDVNKIYAAAERFGLLSLKYTCSRILQDDIHLDNVLETLVLAHEKKDFKLKLSAFKFICHHMEVLQTQYNWDSFLDANPRISIELVEFGRKYMKAVEKK